MAQFYDEVNHEDTWEALLSLDGPMDSELLFIEDESNKQGSPYEF